MKSVTLHNMQKPFKRTKTKQDQYKTLQERASIVKRIKARFQNDIGIDVDSFRAHGFDEFKHMLHQYETEIDLLSGFTGKIYVPEFNKYIQYILPLSKHAHEHVSLVVA